LQHFMDPLCSMNMSQAIGVRLSNLSFASLYSTSDNLLTYHCTLGTSKCNLGLLQS
jgi:hypothetical protein